MKNLLLLLFATVFSTVTLSSQITKVNYLLDHNCETGLYEVKLKVLEGSAMTTGHRAQFNAQLTIVVPTGTSLEIIELINPINDNQQYTGTVPTEWSLGTSAISPVEMSENDFHPYAPRLAPASFYNNIEENDEIILFTCKIGDSEEYNPSYRFFDNDIDPNINEQLGAGAYKNGFTLGGINQIYNENEYASCTATSTKEDHITSISIYPNPFSQEFKIELSEVAESISIIDYSGKQVYMSTNNSVGTITIDAEQFPAGIYMVNVKTANSYSVRKVVKR